MSDTDELKQILLDSQEQSRQQHHEMLDRFDLSDKRHDEHERKHGELLDATKAFVKATDERFKGIETRLDGVERRLSLPSSQQNLQIPATTDDEKPSSGVGRFLEDVATGFTGGIYQPKNR